MLLVQDRISANHTPGRYLYPDQHMGPQAVDKITLHTMGGWVDGTTATFKDPKAARSATYGIGVNKSTSEYKVVQYLSEGDTPWSNTNWIANVQSITIEHEDNDRPNDPRPNGLYDASIELITDICRRYRLDETAIHTHHEYAPTHPCPNTLDVERIKNGVRAALGRVVPVVAPPSTPDYVEERRDVQVVSSVLNVRTGPGTSYPAGQANTPDGCLHNGTNITITGYKVGENVNGNPIWLRTLRGNWVFSGGTSYVPAPPPGVVVTPVSTPLPPAPLPSTFGTVKVTVPTLLVRTGPGRNFSVNSGPYPSLKMGTSVTYVDAVPGESVSGNNIWLKSVRGNFFWSGGTNYGKIGHARVVVSMALGVTKRLQNDAAKALHLS